MNLSMLLQHCALNVEPVAVAAIMRPESNFKPHTIGINHRHMKLERQPANKEEAVSWAKWLIDHGYNIDMGLMQINSSNLKKLGLSVESVFDPCTNINAGTKIFVENYERAAQQYGHGQKAFQAALSAYNTGNFTKGFKNGYVYKVVANINSETLSEVEAVKSPLIDKALTDKDTVKNIGGTVKVSQNNLIIDKLLRQPDNEVNLNPYTADSEIKVFKGYGR